MRVVLFDPDGTPVGSNYLHADAWGRGFTTLAPFRRSPGHSPMDRGTKHPCKKVTVAAICEEAGIGPRSMTASSRVRNRTSREISCTQRSAADGRSAGVHQPGDQAAQPRVGIDHRPGSWFDAGCAARQRHTVLAAEGGLLMGALHQFCDRITESPRDCVLSGTVD